MPIFDYTCNECGHRLEIWTNSHSGAACLCPNCGMEMNRKHGDNVSFRLMGSCWAFDSYGTKPAYDPGKNTE